MNLLKDRIGDGLTYYKQLEYYFLIIEKIEKNVNDNPDISIESCKSIIEGISKFFLKEIDVTYNQKEVDKLEFTPLVRRTIELFSKYDINIESDFLTRTSSLIHIIGEIRNKRGDISHGKLSPKEYSSDSNFARLAIRISEALLVYLFNIFYSLDLSYKEKLKYEDNPDFNEMLDETYIIEDIQYSKALFDQDYTKYQVMLEEFNLQKEELEKEI